MILKQAIQFAFCFGLPRIILPMVPRFVNATIKAKEEVYVVFSVVSFAEQIIIQYRTPR